MEICELCSEKVDYCLCLRCMSCEQLFPESVDYSQDDDGEIICEGCSSK